MTFEELLTKSNDALKQFLGDEKAEPISARTLRYWISRGVLDKRGTRGPNTTYPEALVWRVIFIRQYQRFTSKTLDEIAIAQAALGDDDVLAAVTAFRDQRVGSDNLNHPEIGAWPDSEKKTPTPPSNLWPTREATSLKTMHNGEESITHAINQRLDSFEKALRNSEELTREKLSQSMEDLSHSRYDEFHRLSHQFEEAIHNMLKEIDEIRRESRDAITDLGQKVDRLIDEVAIFKKSLPLNGKDYE